jgi:hypothetical protein
MSYLTGQPIETSDSKLFGCLALSVPWQRHELHILFKNMGTLTDVSKVFRICRAGLVYLLSCTMLRLKLSETASFDVSQLAGGFQTQLQIIKCTT